MEWIWMACFGEFLGIWKLYFVDFQSSIRSSWKMHMLRILATYAKKEHFVATTGHSMPSTSYTSSYMLFYMTALVLVCISFKVLLWNFLCNLIPVILVKCCSCQITARFLLDCNARRCAFWAPIDKPVISQQNISPLPSTAFACNNNVNRHCAFFFFY
jgi:hypothetical protein